MPEVVEKAKEPPTAKPKGRARTTYPDAPAMVKKNDKDGVYKDIKERKCKNPSQDKTIQKSNKDLYLAKTMQKSNKDLYLANSMQQYSNNKDLYPDKTMQKSNKDLGDFEAIFPVAAYDACLLILGVLAAAVGYVSGERCMLGKRQFMSMRRLSKCRGHVSRRVRMDRWRVQQKVRAVLLCAMLCLTPTAEAMQNTPNGGQATGLEEVLTALTTATQVGMQTLVRLEHSSSSSSSSQEPDITRRLESASTSLKNPDTWDGLDFASFTTWKHNFINWICFADSRFGEQLSMIEQLGNEAIDMSGATQADRELSGKLYSILTSYLRGSALQFSRNFVKERCGFRLWQSLLWEFQPSTKQRSLTLSQAIAMYPGFDDLKAMVEQIGSLENLVRDYELSAGKTYDRDLLMGVLLRCAAKTIREHLTVSLPSSANYGSVKQAILNYEKASKTWDYNTVLRSVQKVRAVMVKILFDWENMARNQWNSLANGTPVHACQDVEFQELPTKEWKYRTTIAHLGGNDWEVIEASEKVTEEFKVTGLLFATTMITFARRKVESLDQCLCEALNKEEKGRPVEEDEKK